MKLLPYTLFLFLIVITSCTQESTKGNLLDINGIWEDSAGSNTQNAVMVLTEKKGKVHMAHYLEWKGQKFVEYGVGTRNGNSIMYKAIVTKKIEGWATEGTHRLILSEDGNTLSGTFKDNLNRSGPIVFKRKR